MTNAQEDHFFSDNHEDGFEEVVVSSSAQEEVLEAIELLEEVIPKVEDPVGIYITLFDLQNDLENITQAGEALVKAANLVSADSHADLTYFLYNQLELFSQLSPDAQSAYEQLGQLISEDVGDLGTNTVHLDERKLFQVDLIPELLLANHLLRMHVITDAEYAVCMQDLCWHSSNALTAPRSLLYVMEDQGMPNRERTIEFMAHDSSTPYLNLMLCNFDKELMEVFAPEFCVRRAACVLGEVGGEPMVAMLNPYNLGLKEDVTRLLNSEPHFFLASAEGYQHFLDLQAGMDGE